MQNGIYLHKIHSESVYVLFQVSSFRKKFTTANVCYLLIHSVAAKHDIALRIGSKDKQIQILDGLHLLLSILFQLSVQKLYRLCVYFNRKMQKIQPISFAMIGRSNQACYELEMGFTAMN